MDIGIGAPTRGDIATKNNLKSIAQRGEALGFKSL